MKILAVDDEKIALSNLVEAIAVSAPEAEIYQFQKAKEALIHAENEQVDIAFLDIQMRDMDGITLAKKVKACNPKVNIIFTTGNGEYTYSALELRASGYVMKPVTPEKIHTELIELRNPLKFEKINHLFARTFGTFEIYCDGIPLEFRYTKSKEMLAFLIDRNGALCTNQEIADAIWEEDVENHISYIQKLKKDLQDVLAVKNCENLIIKHWGKMAVNVAELECDYYLWLKGSPEGINAYHGEYMTQYSWAEYTHGRLDMSQENY